MSAEALLHAVRDDPYDDLPRLLLADWLDDNGDPEVAELVRLQLDRARREAPLEGLATFRPEPGERERTLASRTRARWFGDLPDSASAWFRRGLLGLEMPANVLLDDLPPALDRCFRQGWVQSLEVVAEQDHLPLLARCPYLGMVSELALAKAPGADSEAPCSFLDLAESPYLAGLVRLKLSWPDLDSGELETLAYSPFLGRLEALCLEGGQPDGHELEALAGSPHLPNLTELSFVGNHFDPRDIQRLTDALPPGKLRKLALVDTWCNEDALAVLADCPALAALTHLSFHRSAVSSEGLRRIALSPNLPALTHLYLNSRWIRDQGLQAVLDPALSRRLRVLELAWCGLTAEGAQLLASEPALGQLVGLHLPDNPGLGEEGVRALAASPYLTSLQHLTLRACALGLPAVDELAGAPFAPRLTYLDAGLNPLHEAGVQALARGPFDRLAWLDLTSCQGSGTAAREVLSAPGLAKLETFVYRHNPVPGLPEKAPADRAFWLRFLGLGASGG